MSFDETEKTGFKDIGIDYKMYAVVVRRWR